MQSLFLNIHNAKSHPNKLLKNHIEEIIEFARELRKGGFIFDYKFLEVLATYHDLGKCYYYWQKLNLKESKKIVKHSGLSAFLTYLICKKEKRKLVEMLKVPMSSIIEDKLKYLLYFVLVHHSNLAKIEATSVDSKFNLGSPFEGYINQIEDLAKNGLSSWEEFEEFKQYILSFSPQEYKINEKYLNTYAVFKIADRLSGSFHRNLRKEEIPKILFKFGITNIDFELNEDILKNLLKMISGKEVDENRLKNQLAFLNNNINILLAPTGFGKTTFSIFKGIHKNSRFLIALPTITAIKQFLKRTKDIVNEIGYFSDIVGTYFYFYNPFSSVREDEYLILNEYFLSRYLLKPIMLTTVDQLLLTYLQTKEYYIKRFSLQNRLLIIDEVHLLSPKMLYFLLQFLKDYRKLFKDFVFMSATFPKFLREIIQNELDISSENILLLYNYYPKDRIWIDLLIDDFSKLEIKKSEKQKLFERIYNKIKEFTRNKNPKIAVLFNTVNNAQEFYRYLKTKNEDWEIELFHSRYIYRHRKRKEEKLLSISKNEKIKKPFILVATQVIEVSLDIDFDYLISELAPLPELIQRFGRVYRNRKNPNEPNIYIFGFLEESKNIYNKELVRASYKILKDFVGMVDERKLILELDENNEYKSKFLNEYDEARRDYSELVSKWLESHSNRFYCLFLEEDKKAIEEISQLLNIRDSINVMVFVNEDDLDKGEKKIYKKIIKALEESRKTRNFLEFFKAKFGLREFLLSVPFYYVEKIGISKEDKQRRIPVLESGVYSKEMGLDTKKLKEKLEKKGYESIILP